MNEAKNHVVRVRVDNETKDALDEISKNTGKSTSEIIRDGIDRQKDIPQKNQNYVQYKLHGFNNLILKENIQYEIDHPLIRSIHISDDITSMIVHLNDNIHYKEHHIDIERYLNHICFNLIIQTEAELSQPVRILECIHDDNTISCYEHVRILDNVKIVRNYDAEGIYHKIIDSQTSFDKHYIKYERIFHILHNPNKIMQFMSLYQFLLDLLSEGKEHPQQRYITEYFTNNKEKYPLVSFKPTRRPNRDFDEDMFTYIRNEIGHCEETNDFALYEKIGTQITGPLIKDLVSVLNDVINHLD